MRGSRRRIGLGAAMLAVSIAMPAAAQENIDAGKTPAELYAQDCAICHKTAQGLSQAGGIFGLPSFLREHYTASKESAAAIAAYLVAIDRKAPSPAHTRTTRRKAKGEKAKAKKEEISKKTDAAKSAKPEEAKLPPDKPPQAKASEEATSDTKSDAKPKAEAKPAEAKTAPKPGPKHKPVEANADSKADVKADAKTNGTKASDAKPSDAKPEKKAD
jgi:outer membrane biosynthesis protein TonB